MNLIETHDRTCLGTYDSSNPYYTETYYPNAARSWDWLTYVYFAPDVLGYPN